MTPVKTVTLLSLLLLVSAVSAQDKPKPHILECSGSTSSSCQGKQCHVICEDGHKVELECVHGSVDMKYSQAGGVNRIEVTCGSPIDTEDFPSFPPCFPFCATNANGEQASNSPFNQFGYFNPFNPFGWGR